jgi:two-component system sensor histidine kinase and response regulator WspE
VNAEKGNPRDAILKVFLTDLQKDTNTLRTLLLKTKQVEWDQVKQVLSHVAGCARLAKCSVVAQYASMLLDNINKINENPELNVKAIQVIHDGVANLVKLSSEEISLVEWEKKAVEWLQNTPSTPKKSKHESLQIPREQTPEHILGMFANELEIQVEELNKGLLRLEHNRNDKLTLQVMMRAAHSVKGASRVVGLSGIVRLAHIIEECFVSAQQHRIDLGEKEVEHLFKAVDFLSKLSKEPPLEIPPYMRSNSDEVDKLCHNLEECIFAAGGTFTPLSEIIEDVDQGIFPDEPLLIPLAPSQAQQRALRVTAETLNRLMGIAGEALVESRWLTPFSASLMKIKREQGAFASLLDELRTIVGEKLQGDRLDDEFSLLLHNIGHCQHELSNRLSEFEMFSRRYSKIAERLYHEVIESRMRPFSDITGGFPRMIRDLAKQLHKKVVFEMRGESTPVDREILEKLEIPLTHILRNSIDHGIELPLERAQKGKLEEGSIVLTAQHRAGMLAIEVSDDGAGVDIEQIKQTILARNLASKEILKSLTKQELFEFMLLPGFSTSKNVTEISGRGVGLSSVQTFVHEVGGRITLSSEYGQGFHISMILPLTLSVVRALLIQIGSEPYALPLAKIEKVHVVEKKQLEYVEQRPFFRLQDENVGLISASEVLELPPFPTGDLLPVVVLSDQNNHYGIIVDKFIGEKELVVQELDPLLGKVPNISTGAFMEDGSPILILDVEDLLRTIDMSLSGGRLKSFRGIESLEGVKRKKKRILVVDDSITVREVECRLLENQGYEVETAVNGMDGWNALRTASYDLIVTDIDMPRMNGIDFVKSIRADARFSDLPVMIVSYKERDEDRVKGLEAGANYYLTKSSFHDETLVKAVKDLIGEASTGAYP